MSENRRSGATGGTRARARYLVAALVLVAGGAFAWWQWGGRGNTVTVTVPALSPLAKTGERAFAADCARCHGVNGAGTDRGPPLIHDLYNPGHHPDAAFVRAVRYGVRQHHWPYGNMPPRPEVSDAELAAIIRYVRELQRANGIHYKPHIM